MAGAIGQSINAPSRVSAVSQLLYLFKNGQLVAPVEKIVVDIILTGITDIVDALIILIDSKLK